jgi:EAL and modified HD-GYP domain-containing signal transduction protein
MSQSHAEAPQPDSDSSAVALPLVGLQPVANAHNEWVAVTLQLPAGDGDGSTLPALSAISAALGPSQAFLALAPLDLIIPVADPRQLSAALLERLPPHRVLFCMPAALCGERTVQEKCVALTDAGYRLLLDGPAGGDAGKTGARGLTYDCAGPLPPLLQMMALPGPHLARGVDRLEQLAACRTAGFAWFTGAYPLAMPKGGTAATDGTSRKRLLALLGLLARDADGRELEVLLKQDPALSFHLLKLVNSAAFALSKPISSFTQAINVLGRRQLQRWLQLLLYARQQLDGLANPLLPIAAVRAAHMEALCQIEGGDRDAQDQAFMVGVFSLLDVLLGMPMDDIIGALNLHDDVSAALRTGAGPLGALLALVAAPVVAPAHLSAAGIDSALYWRSLLPAYQWAISVSRNL